MSLTPQQIAVLGTYIANTPALSALPNTQDGAYSIAVMLNQPDPSFVVWRTYVAIDEIMNNGFAWDRVDNATVGQARIWDWMRQNGSINPSKQNVRDGIDAAWPGAANAAQRTGIYSHCKRNPTIAEKLFATGTGTDVTPGLLVFEGSVSYPEVYSARNP